MEQDLVDLDFLYQISGKDPVYMYELITIFMEVVQPGVAKLKEIVAETNDFNAIHKQAHYLKSSAAIIKIKGIFEDLTRIVALATEHKGKEEIEAITANIVANFNKAIPFLLAEKGKYAP